MGHHYGYVSEQLITGGRSRTGASGGAHADPTGSPSMPPVDGLDVEAMRTHFDFPATGRVVTNNAATTQTPRELIDLYRSLLPGTKVSTAGSPGLRSA